MFRESFQLGKRQHNQRSRCGGRRWLASCCALLVAVMVTGCGTTATNRVTEQLLLSDAVDAAIAEIDFRDLAGQNVYLDSTYIQTTKEQAHYTQYLVSSLRQQLLAAGCVLEANRNDALIVVEPRVGALGTEAQNVTFGIPKSQEISTAAALFANAPVVPAIPEIALGKSDLQTGAAKIALFAYYRESKEPVWQSGTRVARSNSKSTWVLGAGPLQRGSIYDGVHFAGIKMGLPTFGGGNDEPEFSQPSIPLASEVHFVPRNQHPIPPIDLEPLRPPEASIAGGSEEASAQ